MKKPKPTRYLWSHRQEYLADRSLGRWFRPLVGYLQSADLINSRRPDLYVAISRTVKERIKKYYQRNSLVIYPPVAIERFSSYSGPGDYFLVVSRLTGYKKVDLAVKAANELRQKLLIVGRGREEAYWKKLAGPTVSFLGEVSETELTGLYQHCRALIMPQEEDFGIAAVEAQAAGRPVIAFNQGGATETVIPGETGIFFKEATVDSLKAAMKQFESCSWDSRLIRSQAQKFKEGIFCQKIKKLVEEKCLTKNFRSKL